jgi:hypothetical protein
VVYEVLGLTTEDNIFQFAVMKTWYMKDLGLGHDVDVREGPQKKGKI